MIEEFKDILEKYFEKTGKIIDRNKIVVTRYEEIDGYVIGFLHLSFSRADSSIQDLVQT